MKTSTKLLLFTVFVLFSTTVVYVLVLKGMFDKGDYTMKRMYTVTAPQIPDMESYDFNNFRHLHIRGANGLHVQVSQQDHDAVKAVKNEWLTLSQQNDTLFIESKLNKTRSESTVQVVIHCTELSSVAISGTEHVETRNIRNRTETISYFSSARLTISQFSREEDLDVYVGTGGNISFIDNHFRALNCVLDTQARAELTKTNTVKLLNINLSAGSDFDLNQANIDQIVGNIDSLAELRISGGTFQIMRP